MDPMLMWILIGIVGIAIVTVIVVASVTAVTSAVVEDENKPEE